jgi:hypothetical protein
VGGTIGTLAHFIVDPDRQSAPTETVLVSGVDAIAGASFKVTLTGSCK